MSTAFSPDTAMGTDAIILEQIESAKVRMAILIRQENWAGLKVSAEHCARLDEELRNRHNARRQKRGAA
jgi:hypothetical protein